MDSEEDGLVNAMITRASLVGLLRHVLGRLGRRRLLGVLRVRLGLRLLVLLRLDERDGQALGALRGVVAVVLPRLQVGMSIDWRQLTARAVFSFGLSLGIVYTLNWCTLSTVSLSGSAMHVSAITTDSPALRLPTAGRILNMEFDVHLTLYARALSSVLVSLIEPANG